jgi:hypothetical protein
MPGGNQMGEFSERGEKPVLHPCQLQRMSPTSFVQVADQELCGHLRLLSLRPQIEIPLAAEEN